MNNVEINCIVAVDSQFGISKDGTIPWNISEDLKYFKKITSYTEDPNLCNAIVMGYNTWTNITKGDDSKHLPDRINVVITQNHNVNNPYVLVYKSIKEATDELCIRHDINKIFFIGGKNILEYVIRNKTCSYIYLNLIERDYSCDNILNLIDLDDYDLDWYSKINVLDKSDNTYVNITFRKYKILQKLNQEKQYLKIMKNILNYGHRRQTRNGITYSLFGGHMEFELYDNTYPLLTTKKMFMKGIFEELKFFMLGQSDSKILESKGVKIWTGNTSRKFLDSVGLNHLEEGDIGPLYSFQFRHAGAKYIDCKTDYTNQGFDQLQYVIDTLKYDRYSRRIIMTTFNPSQSHEAPLYPCHGIAIQFGITEEDFLDCHVYLRSQDWFLGTPFNIASYALMVYIILEIVNNSDDNKYGNLYAGKLIMSLGDTHIYEQHIEAVEQQLKRKPYPLPKIKFNKKLKSLDDLNHFELSDISIFDYTSHGALKAPMIA